VGTIQKYVIDSVADKQLKLARPMNDAELVKHIDGLFAQDAKFRNLWTGGGHGSIYSQKLLSMKVSDIPPDSLAAAKASLARAGAMNPTDEQILHTYWNWKSKR